MCIRDRCGTTPCDYELLKLDGDGPEGAWLRRVEELIEAGSLTARTIAVECNGCTIDVLIKLQQRHRYAVYALDMHIDQRFLDDRGVDVYEGFRQTPLPSFVDELYSVRLMRHLYRFADNMTEGDWQAIHRGSAADRAPSVPLFRRAAQYLFTKVELLEPRYEHPIAVQEPSAGRRHAARGALRRAFDHG